VFELRSRCVRRALTIRVHRYLLQKSVDHTWVSNDRLNIVAESGLPLGCAHIGGESTYAISCASSTTARPTSPPYVAYALYLRDRRISIHIAALCARYSFRLTNTATVRKSVPHGCGRDNPKYTSPTVLEFAPRSSRRIPFCCAQKHCLGFQEICQWNRRMITFSACEGAKSCPDVCGGV
jgi:hypothetical protein